MYKICSTLTIKTSEPRQSRLSHIFCVSIVHFEQANAELFLGSFEIVAHATEKIE